MALVKASKNLTVISSVESSCCKAIKNAIIRDMNRMQYWVKVGAVKKHYRSQTFSSSI
jgi:hypothetical protein